MNGKTSNGKTTDQARAAGSSLPARSDNPFLQPAWPKRRSPEPFPPDPGSRLTREQRRLVDKGRGQQIKQHFQHTKTVYAVHATADVDDLANAGYFHVGTNIVQRKRSNPYEELQPFLDVMMEAQLLRLGPELNQIASDHARTQNEIASEVIETDEEASNSLWDKLARAVSRDF